MTTVPPTQLREADDLLTRLSLLLAQSFFLGLTLGLLAVSAIALLLSSYGAGAFPYVYIVVAIFGSIAFYGFAEVQRRWSLVQVSIVTELVIAVFLVIAWAGLVFAQAEWLAFAAMVVFSLIIQIGFVIIGGQAGRLLDVRQIKRYFPRIVGGFVVGFIVAGAVVTPLQNWLGGTEYLLLAAAASATIMLGMLLATNTRYNRILAQAGDGSGPKVEPPPLRKVLAKRFVIFIFAYQMLSAMVSQLLDFMVIAAAGERFVDSDALASFFGNYTFFLNIFDLLFLALVAGLLLSRFGLKFGLMANPVVDMVLLVAIVVTGLIGEPVVILFFWLVVIGRPIDIVFTDGMTRTSINAAFQALPANERVSVQTGVEGIGVPLALGLTGVALLLFDALGNVTLVHVAVFTFVVALFWLASAAYVYRDYAANLIKSMRRRFLDPVELNLEDNANLEVAIRLLDGDSLSNVRLALDMLQGAEHPCLPDQLTKLLQSESAAVQVEALARIERLKLQQALPMVKHLSAATGDAVLQGAALRTLCALREAEAVETVAPYLESSQRAVRLGAAVGLLRYGSIPGVLAVGRLFESWAQAEDADDRRFLAQVIGEVALEHAYQPLISLLVDPDARVRRAALSAAGNVKHPRLLPLIVQNLAEAATRSAASDALVSYGDQVLPLVEEALTAEVCSEMNTMRLVRVCSQIKGEEVQALMLRNLDHASTLVRDQILAVLSACGFHAEAADRALLNQALVGDVGRGHQLMQAWQDCREGEATAALRQALLDEGAQVIRRVFLELSFIYESRSVLQAQMQLVNGTSGERALALEMLDVTLAAEHQGLVFPIIDPTLEMAQRIELLNRRFSDESLARNQRLQELAENNDQGWIRSCALYAIIKLETGEQPAAAEVVGLVEGALADPDPVVRETAAWGLFRAAPQRFSEHAAALLDDEDQQIVDLVAGLSDKQR